MRKLGRPGLGAAILCAGIVVGAVGFSGRTKNALGSQGTPGEARPAALLQVEPPRAGSMDSPPARNDIRTTMVLISTRRVIEQTLADRLIAGLACLKGRTDAASWLAAHLQIENPEGTSLIRLSMAPAAGVTAEEQATLVNAVAKTFVEHIRGKERIVHEERQERLEFELASRQRNRRELEDQLNLLLLKDEGKLAAQVPRDMLASYGMDLRRKRLEIDVELAGARAVVARRKERTPTTPADAEDFARIVDRVSALEAQGSILDQEKKQIEMALGQSGESRNLSVARLREALRHHDASVEKLVEHRDALARERDAGPPRIELIDPAVAR
jgi:hypothetical protein